MRQLLTDAAGLLPEDFKVQAAKQLWMDALEASKTEVVKGHAIICKNCTHKHIYDIPVERPDLKTRLLALEVLLNQSLGKPTETKRIEYDYSAITRDALSTMSTAQLAEMAGIVDGEWHELPPPRELNGGSDGDAEEA